MNEEEKFKLEVTRQYKITDKTGTQINLDEEDMKALLKRGEIRELLPLAWSQDNYGNIHMQRNDNISVLANGSSETELPLPLKRKVMIPAGFQKFYQKGCDPRAPYQSIFDYYKSDDGEYGYFSFDKDDGKLTKFKRLGRIEDPDSTIGAFVRAFMKKYPKNTEKLPIKSELYELGSVGATDGRKVKAVLDILEREKYIKTKPNPDKQNRPGYIRTEKLDRLEELLKHEQEVHTSPLTQSQ